MNLTVMTYNIRMGTFNPWGLEGIARVIEQQQPDVVGLQEVNVYSYPTGPVDQPRWLAHRLGMQSAFGMVREFPEKVIPKRRGATGAVRQARLAIPTRMVGQVP